MFGFLKKTVNGLVEGVKNKIFVHKKPEDRDEEEKEKTPHEVVEEEHNEAAKVHSAIEEPVPRVNERTEVPETTAGVEAAPAREIKPVETKAEGKKERTQTQKPAVVAVTIKAHEPRQPVHPSVKQTEPEIIPENDNSPPSSQTQPTVQQDEMKKGFSAKIMDTLGRMRERTSKIITGVHKAIEEHEIKESDVSSLLWEFNLNLIQSNIAPEVSERITERLKQDMVGSRIRRGSDVEKLLKTSLKKSLEEILGVDAPDFVKKVREKKPCLVLFLGFNGSGKTTTIAKLANLLQKEGLSCVLAAGDCFRAASIEQLEVHGKRLGVRVIKQSYGSDSAAVIFDAMNYARAHDIDVVLADTAGRVHTNVNLMNELQKIARVNKPDFKILVLDSLSGTDIINQSKLFDETVSVDGIVLTKYDVDEKGGAAISAASSIRKPILFVGTGQEYGDIKKFDVDEFISSILEWDEEKAEEITAS